MRGNLKVPAIFIALGLLCGADEQLLAENRADNAGQPFPNAPVYWRDHIDKKAKKEAFDVWLSANDYVVRYTSSHLCGEYVRSSLDSLRINANRIRKKRSEKKQDNYIVKDVIWVSPQSSLNISIGDVIISYDKEDYAGKPISEKEIPQPSGATTIQKQYRKLDSITGLASLDEMLLSNDNIDKKEVIYRDGEFFFPAEPSFEINKSSHAKACKGGVIGNSGFWATSLFSTINNAIGIEKELFDNNSDRYVPGLNLKSDGHISFRSSTSKIFSDKQLQWMLADALGIDLGVVALTTDEISSFDTIASKFVIAVGNKLGVEEKKAEDVFRIWERRRGMYMAIYVGANAGWSIDDYISFLDQREAELHGRVDPEYKKMREEILRYWHADMVKNHDGSSKFSPNIPASVAAMTQYIS